MSDHKRIWAAVLVLVLFLLAGCTEPDPAPATAPVTVPAETTAVTEAPTEAPTEATEPEAAQQVRTVSDVEQLLACLQDNTEIILEAGEYCLSESQSYGKPGSRSDEYWVWDGSEGTYTLRIEGISNLTIRAAEGADVSILTEPRYADVLHFADCRNVRLEGLTVGHSAGAGGCLGSVLHFTRCSDTLVQDCRLFGCGTWGVEADSSRTLRVLDSEIYGCSRGGASLSACYDVQLDGCRIYNNDAPYEGLICMKQCREAAVTNCTVTDNRVRCLFNVTGRGIYLGGNELDCNTLDECLYLCGDPSEAVMEGCVYREGNLLTDGALYSGQGQRLKRADGAALSDDELREMTLAPAAWAPAPLPVPEAPLPGPDGKLHVGTVDEFLAALQSDVTIVLEPGIYRLDRAADYGDVTGLFNGSYAWEEEYDGYTLTLQGLENLTIEGAGVDRTELRTDSRFVEVLRLRECSGVTLRGLNLGHTPGLGECTGNVLNVALCQNTVIEGCSLYGCGVDGIFAYHVNELQVVDTELHHCSGYAASLYESRYVSFQNCDLHDNQYEGIYTFDSEFVSLNGEEIE